MEKGSSEDQESLVKEVMDEIHKNLKESMGDLYEQDKVFIDNATDSVSGSMDSVVEQGKNMFYPLIRTFNNIGHAVQKELQHIPLMGRMFTDEMTEHWKGAFGEIKGIFSQHMSAIFAPLDVLIGPFKALGKSAMVLFKAMNSGPTEYEKSVVEYLKRIAGIMEEGNEDSERNWKQSLKDKAKEKAQSFYQNDPDMLDRIEKWFISGSMMVVAAVGLLIGATVGKILLPFQVLFKAVNAIIPLGGMKGFITPIVTFFKGLVEMAAPIGTFLTQLPLVGNMFAKFGQYLGTFFSAFQVGFKHLAWPLQIVMSLIDFIKGFRNTEGDMLDKIMGGLKQVVIGFIEMPIRMLSWLFEKVMGFFGVEITGTADKIMEGVSLLMDFITGWWKTIIKTIMIPFKAIGAFVGSIFDSIGNVITGYFGGLWDIIVGVFTLDAGKIWSGLKGIFGSIVDLVMTPFRAVEAMVGSVMDSLTGIFNHIGNWIGGLFTGIVDFFDLGAVVDRVKQWVFDKVPGAEWLFGDSEEEAAEKVEVAKEEKRRLNSTSVGVTESGSLLNATSIRNGFEDKARADEMVRGMGGRVLEDEELRTRKEANQAELDEAREKLAEIKERNSGTMLQKLDRVVVSMFGKGEGYQEEYQENEKMFSFSDNPFMDMLKNFSPSFGAGTMTGEAGKRAPAGKVDPMIGGKEESYWDNLMIEKNRDWFNNASDVERMKIANTLKKKKPEDMSTVQAEMWRDLKDYASPDMVKQVPVIIQPSPEMAKAGAVLQQTKANEALVGEMKNAVSGIINTNNSVQEGTHTTNNTLQNVASTQVNDKKNIPDGVESLSVMLVNKSWGMV
jgi:hypothetical protein